MPIRKSVDRVKGVDTPKGVHKAESVDTLENVYTVERVHAVESALTGRVYIQSWSTRNWGCTYSREFE